MEREIRFKGTRIGPPTGGNLVRNIGGSNNCLSHYAPGKETRENDRKNKNNKGKKG